jgi:predicted RNase H-like nuclease (RuvC/YqgF family)
MLEIHVLEALPLREACRRVGLPYHKNVSQHKSSKSGKAYVTQLKRRRKVIEEFGADIPSLARLIEIRDMALLAESYTAATRAHELCVREASKANSDRKRTGAEKEVAQMTREEMLAEIQEIMTCPPKTGPC